MLTLWLNEPEADAVESAIRGADLLVTSALTDVECLRAFHRQRALGGLPAATCDQLLTQWSILMDRCDVLMFDAVVCARARRAFKAEPIRALDALHVAFVERVQDARGAVVLLSLDRRLRAVAAAEGISVAPCMPL